MRELVRGIRLASPMRRGVVLLILVVLTFTGCGSSDTTTSTVGRKPPTTSAQEVNEMVELLEEDEALKHAYAEERDACGEVTPMKEYSEACAVPWAEKATRRNSVDQALVNELIAKV